MTQVLIISPSRAVRAGLRALLAEGGAEVAGEAPSFARVDLASADAVLLADESQLADAEQALREHARPLALVVLAERPQVAAALRDMPLAGWAVVPQDSGPAELAAAIAAAAQGFAALPVAMARRAIASGPPGAGLAAPSAEPLTPREREILQLLGQGLSNKMIARDLGVSDHTVKFHVSSIYAKLGAANRAEAVNLGARLGLVAL
ncbi:response regulator transcription factor [Chloroflexia bacterium SDU3-3]|nr:response regulator transcription factor [Chloroflexia bacterium SDU3-3]